MLTNAAPLQFPPPPPGAAASIIAPDTAARALGHLRKVASLVRAGACHMELMRCLPELHDVAVSLQEHYDEMAEAFDIDGPFTMTRRGKSFNVFFLLRCFWVANCLKSSNDLDRVSQAACRIILPKAASPTVKVLKVFLL